MRIVKRMITLICALWLIDGNAEVNPIHRLNISLWTNYTGLELEGLSQNEKTAKFQYLFQDLLRFSENSKPRRLIIKVLDPSKCLFFHPDHFDSIRDDNIFYWIHKLKDHAEIEVVFDPAPFCISGQSWSEWLLTHIQNSFKIQKTLDNFFNLGEKLAWVSYINQLEDPYSKFGPMIRGITINPKGISDRVCQLIINTLDKYKYNTSKDLPPNNFPALRTAICLNLDQKALAYCNLARFPLLTDMRSEKPNEIGLTVPENFPSEGPKFLAPSWRSHNNFPLLDHVYINLADKRLVNTVYQDHSILPHPEEDNIEGAKALAIHLGNCFTGTPFVKGPGKITIHKGMIDVQGLYTYFRTGGKFREGQFTKDCIIEVRPPYVGKAVQKMISDSPENNCHMRLTSALSTTQDLLEADYYYSPIPTRWDIPKISNFIRLKLYYVFDTSFNPHDEGFLGNWSLKNVLSFLQHSSSSKSAGFLSQRLFRDFDGNMTPPMNNIIFHDFTTLPNGHPNPECNWRLGNQSYE